MSVTDGCNKDTSKLMGSNVRTLIVTTQQLEVLIAGLPKQIAHYKALVANLDAGGSGLTPVATYWREQVKIAEETLETLRGAVA